MAKVTQIVTFDGVPEKLVGHVIDMLRRDIAAYPDRCSMDKATVSDAAVRVKRGKSDG